MIIEMVSSDAEFTKKESEDIILGQAGRTGLHGEHAGLSPASVGVLSHLHSALHTVMPPSSVPAECLNELRSANLIKVKVIGQGRASVTLLHP